MQKVTAKKGDKKNWKSRGYDEMKHFNDNGGRGHEFKLEVLRDEVLDESCNLQDKGILRVEFLENHQYGVQDLWRVTGRDARRKFLIC